MPRTTCVPLSLALSLPLLVLTQPVRAQTPPNPPEWVRRSNQYWQIASDALKTRIPESLSASGAQEMDSSISDFSIGSDTRTMQAYANAIQNVREQRKSEDGLLVRQDVELLLRRLERDRDDIALSRKYFVPYANLSQRIFSGLRALLDDQVPPERRKAALARLRKYAGMEPGTIPVTRLCEQRTRAGLNRPGLLGPCRESFEADMANSVTLMEGLGPLFAKYQIVGYEEPLARLKEQIANYNEFLNLEVRPRCREGFRLPPELYRSLLEDAGIDIPPDQLARLAHTAFTQIQAQMQTLAQQVAQRHGWKLVDYRDVVRELKKDQVVGAAILPHYRRRLAQIEAIIRREDLISLPNRATRIRLATPAETAEQPSPCMNPPRLLGNTGEQGEFVLPLGLPGSANSAQTALRYDDFTCEAASWTLTAHEARPGHEMQFATMVDKGVSSIRALAASNAVNIEGWGLYAEKMIYPYMPPEGQLISLQLRLLRAARAFCDPELQTGAMTPEQVYTLLRRDVGLSKAFAAEELDRFLYRAPGQATSYFYGYRKLLALRSEVEQKQGAAFRARRFHDAVLAQGLLPPDMLRASVLAELGLPEGKDEGGRMKDELGFGY